MHIIDQMEPLTIAQLQTIKNKKVGYHVASKLWYSAILLNSRHCHPQNGIFGLY